MVSLRDFPYNSAWFGLAIQWPLQDGGAQVTSFFDLHFLLVLYRYIFVWCFEATKQIEKILGRTLTWSMLIFWYLPATKDVLEDSYVVSNPGSTSFWSKYQKLFESTYTWMCFVFWILCQKKIQQFSPGKFNTPENHDHPKRRPPMKNTKTCIWTTH